MARLTDISRSISIQFVVYLILHFNESNGLACVPSEPKDAVFNEHVMLSCEISSPCTRAVWRKSTGNLQSEFRDIIPQTSCSDTICNIQDGNRFILNIYRFSLPGATCFQCFCDATATAPRIVLGFIVTGICKAEVSIGTKVSVFSSNDTSGRQDAPPNKVSMDEGSDVTINCSGGDTRIESNCSSIKERVSGSSVSFTASSSHSKCHVQCIGRSISCTVDLLLDVTAEVQTTQTTKVNRVTEPPKEEVSKGTLDAVLPTAVDSKGSLILLIALIVVFLVLLVIACGLALYLFLPACKIRRQASGKKSKPGHLALPTYAVVSESMSKSGDQQLVGKEGGHFDSEGRNKVEQQKVINDNTDRDGGIPSSDIKKRNDDGFLMENEYATADVSQTTEQVSAMTRTGNNVGSAMTDQEYADVRKGAGLLTVPKTSTDEYVQNQIPEYASVSRDASSIGTPESSRRVDKMRLGREYDDIDIVNQMERTPSSSSERLDATLPEYAAVIRKKGDEGTPKTSRRIDEKNVGGEYDDVDIVNRSKEEISPPVKETDTIPEYAAVIRK